jgi:recombination protein RecR
MSSLSLLDQLTQAFCCLPGVGKKSAQRMVFTLLEKNRQGGEVLGKTLLNAMANIKNCAQCRTFTENELCFLCQDSARQNEILCIVESPSDILAIEQSASFRGKYFVLMGHLSPIDGVGPKDLGIDKLIQQVKKSGVKEVIIATNPTIEGEATSFYIAEILKEFSIIVSRIAHGVPLGGELEYVDSHTISHAFLGRKAIE